MFRSRSGSDETVMFQLAIGLEHGVRVDGEPVTTTSDGWELVALAQQPERRARRTWWTSWRYGATPERVSR